MTAASTPEPADATSAPAAPTPKPAGPGRDRFISAARALAIFSVVLVHWSLAIPDQYGLGLRGLDDAFGLRWIGYASWIFAYGIPLFFAMFGTLSARAARGRVRTFYRRRLIRLLIPYWVYCGVMLTIEFALWAGNVGNCGRQIEGTALWFGFSPLKALSWVLPYPHFDCLGLGQAPFWFLSVLLALTVAFPLLVRMYDRPALRLLALAGFVGTTLLLDLVGKMSGLSRQDLAASPIGLVQILVVWSYFGWLGCFYADGIHLKPNFRRNGLLIAIGLTVLTLVMVIGPYPDALLTASNGNQFPPTLAYLFAGTAALLYLLVLREPIMRLSETRALERIVDWLDSRNYTIYIWHMAALTVVYWVLRFAGLTAITPTGATYLPWLPLALDRLTWFALGWLVLVPLVKLFFPVESWDLPKLKRPRPTTPSSEVSSASPSGS